jgi:hypothetical protein
MGLFLRQHLAQLIFIRRLVHGPKPYVREALNAVAIDDHARGHAVDLEALGDRSLWVEAHVEIGFEFGEEPVCVLLRPVEVDGYYRQALALVRILHSLHPGKGLPAGRAPRCPKVQIDDAAAQTVEIERRGGICIPERQKQSRAQKVSCCLFDRHRAFPQVHVASRMYRLIGRDCKYFVLQSELLSSAGRRGFQSLTLCQ